MSVTITVTDPSSTPAEELQAVVTMLRGFYSQPCAYVEVTPEEKEALAPVATVADVEEVMPLERGSNGGLNVVAPAAAFAFASALPPPPPAQAVATLLVGGVPVGTVTDIQVTPASVELDKEGIPWDGRIHASTKTKTVEGVWKKKRNIEPALVDEVTAELRAVMAVPAPPVPVMAVPAPPVPVAAAVPAPPEDAKEAAAIPVPPAPSAGFGFAEFMGHVTAGVTSSRFTREDVAAACVKSGVPNLPGLINRPDLIPSVARELGLMA